jgi:hypothetical protein
MVRFSLLCCTGQIVRETEKGKVQFVVLYRTNCETRLEWLGSICCVVQDRL